MEAFLNFCDSVSKAKFDFKAIGDFFNARIADILGNAELMTLWNNIYSVIKPLGIALPIILMILGALMVLFGKKFISVQRFVVFFVVGYCIGVQYVSPIINNVLVLPNYVSGIVIALVAAVLCKYLYFLLLGASVFYSVYYLCFTAIHLTFLQNLTMGNGIISFIVAACIVALVFVFRKYVEMAGTSALGAIIISKSFAIGIYNYTALPFLGDKGWIAELVIIGLITVVGTVFQIRHRKRY